VSDKDDEAFIQLAFERSSDSIVKHLFSKCWIEDEFITIWCPAALARLATKAR